MNIQQQSGIVSTINFTPYFESEENTSLRKRLFDQAIAKSNSSPKNHIDIFDESILIFDSCFQALNFLVHVFRAAIQLEKFSNFDLNLRSSLCQGDYFIHQDQIYGEAVNHATSLSCSSRENELLVCGIDIEVIDEFVKRQGGDVAYHVRDVNAKCVSIRLLDKDTTNAQLDSKVFQIEYHNKPLIFGTARNRKIGIGRADDADILITGDKISRNHATITLNYDIAYIEDHSANGTYIYFDDREIFLNNESMKIGSEGYISCGQNKRPNTKLSDIISFKLLEQTRSAA